MEEEHVVRNVLHAEIPGIRTRGRPNITQKEIWNLELWAQIKWWTTGRRGENNHQPYRRHQV